jgi:hypothetical protein
MVPNILKDHSAFIFQYLYGSILLWVFQVHVDNTVDASSGKAYGPGLDPKKCRAGTPLAFKVDATKSGKAPLGVNMQSDRGMWSFVCSTLWLKDKLGCKVAFFSSHT